MNLVGIRPHFSPEYATMYESNNSTIALPAVSSKDVLTAILREGAQRMLAQAVEAEVAEWIDGHAHLTDKDGHRQVVRNGRVKTRGLPASTTPADIRNSDLPKPKPVNHSSHIASRFRHAAGIANESHIALSARPWSESRWPNRHRRIPARPNLCIQ